MCRKIILSKVSFILFFLILSAHQKVYAEIINFVSLVPGEGQLRDKFIATKKNIEENWSENIDTSMVGIGGTFEANSSILYLNEMTAATTGHNVNGNDLGANFQVQIQGFYKTT